MSLRVSKDIISLTIAPTGKSSADARAERAIQWAESKMKYDMTDIEREASKRALKLNKQRQELVREHKNIKTTKENAQDATKKVGDSKFLKEEKKRLHRLLEMNRLGVAMDDYRSDGNTSDDSSVYSFDDNDSVFSSLEFDADNSSRKKSNFSRHHRHQMKGSYEERSRDKRIENLQRRYSAQVHTEPIVNVNRRLKYSKDKD